MLYLKADTITEVTIGPAVAVGDGFTPVTSLVGSTADEFEIIKHGATSTTTIAGTLAAITGADGYYALDLSATDTDTEGRLVLLINDDSLILPIKHEFMVVNANVFDSMFAAAGTDQLQTDVTEIVGGTVPTPATTGIPDVNVREWLDTAVTLGSGAPDVNIQSTDDIDLSATQKASVNTEVVDVMTVDTVTLPGQAAPSATPTMRDILGWIYKTFRNKKTQTSTTWSLFDDAGSTVDSKATVSDSAGTATKEEIATGP